MRELGLAALIVGALAAFGALFKLEVETLLDLGVVVAALGAGFGIPTGFVYHLLLRRALIATGELERGWFWRPLQFNRRLEPAARRRVMPWCYAGAAGFFGIVCGQACLVVAIVKISL
jgi:hypothetical protein